jgi:inward rectifier potassium channel
MALFKRNTSKFQTNNDTGFGNNASSQAGRFINKDGSFNVRRVGLNFFTRNSLYNDLLAMSTGKFVFFVFISFTLVNLLFSCIYFLLGSEQFMGMVTTETFDRFKEFFFFSTQTFTTVGYGRINPVGDAASLISSVEALTGLLSFAIITGLLYGRFSRPRAFLRFSKWALVSPYQNGHALMFRFVSEKSKHILTDVEVRVTLAMTIQENGKDVFRFYTLPLERNRIDSLAMSWTIVHPIDDNSPLFQMTEKVMSESDVEIYVLVRAFDDVFSNTVLQRFSYTYQEIRSGFKFLPMYHESEDQSTTILNLDKLDEMVEVPQTNVKIV